MTQIDANTMTDPGATARLRPARFNGDVLARLMALAISVACVGVLLIAAWLDPDPSGVGTHTGLGLPPCGFQLATTLPCATCGMTTSFSLMAHGRPWDAFVTQPAGALLSLLTAMAAVVTGYAAWSGMSLLPLGRALWRPRNIVTAIAILLAAWAYKTVTMFGG